MNQPERVAKAKELTGLIVAASGALVRARLAEESLRERLTKAEQQSATESERLVLLVNELRDLVSDEKGTER